MLRFSLRTLLLLVLLSGAVRLVYVKWLPWHAAMKLQCNRPDDPFCDDSEGIVWTPSIRFSTDGSKILCINHVRVPRIFDSSTGEVLFDLPRGELLGEENGGGSKDADYKALWIDVSPDGRHALVLRSDGIVIWDTVSREKNQVPQATGKDTSGNPERIECAYFTADSSRLITRDADFGLNVRDLQTGTVVAENHGSIIDFSRQRDRVFIHDFFRKNRDQVIEAPSGRVLFTHPITEKVEDRPQRAVFSDKPRLFAVEYSNRTVLCDCSSSGSADVTAKGPVISTDGSRLIGISMDVDHALRIYDLAARESCVRLDDYKAEYAFSPDGSRVAAVYRELTLYDAANGRTLQVLNDVHSERDLVDHVDFHPDGSKVVTLDSRGLAVVWERRRPEEWWGVAWLPEFWLAALFGLLLVWSVGRECQVR